MVDDNKKETSRGIILELIYDICASEAALCHDKETLQLYELDLKEKEDTLDIIKSEGESSQEVILEIQKIKEKINSINKLIKLETKTRRQKQSLLEELSKSYDKRFHCKIKHWCRVIEHDFEIIDSYDYNKFKEILKTDFENLALSLSLYLEIDYSDCYRCVSDML